jgi:penicillin G amidase
VLSRAVSIINVSLAILLLLAAVIIYWYAYRPLPKISGELRAPVDGPATVKRDQRGIPHIEASSWQDAIFLQGFVTAQDRLWQMDVLRRFGSGELAEVFGPAALTADEQSRRMRMRAIAETQVSLLSPSDRAVLVAYARGVNYFIDTHRGDYSLEFSLPGHAYDPKPWTLSDSLVIGLDMFRDLTDTAKFEFDKGVFLNTSPDSAKARVLFPALQGQYVSPGSNAWVVSGLHTAEGKPILANDTHLSYNIPPTWYLVHLKAPGLDVTGASLPGVPCVISGHNRYIAWGVTNVQADVMDLYQEQLDERTGRYLFKGKVEQAQLDHQMIGVKEQKPKALDIWITRHGPVLLNAGGKAYTMRWSATDGFGFPFFDLDRAKNWREFHAALASFWGPGQNFVFADTAGNIGYQATGRFPIRRGFDGDVPLDGASGNFEWDGYIPFEQLPTFLNPPSGLVATANQNPFPPGYPYRVDGSYHDRYRIRQIRARLEGRQKLTVGDMLAIQKDIYSAYNSFLARQSVAAFTRRRSNNPLFNDPLLREAIDILRQWNGQMDKNEAAPMITQLLNNQLGSQLVLGLLPSVERQNVESGLQSRPQASAEKTDGRPEAAKAQPSGSENSFAPTILPRPFVIQDLLTNRPSGWVDNDDWDSWLLENLNRAIQEGRKLQGTPISKWRWGRVLRWKFEHPIGKELPLVSGYFDIGPVEMSGSGTTVKQTTATLGPSERMVVDLGDWDKSVQNLTTGESGHVASKHYKDEWPAYYVGRSFPMEFERIGAADVLTIHPEK